MATASKPSLAEALLAVQGAMPDLQKNSSNPHFGNRYISLDALMDVVRPVLQEHKFVLLQLPTIAEGQPALRTHLLHVPSGEAVEDTMLLVLGKNDPQGQGSAITYARRYGLMSLLALVAAEDDDDGNAASRRSQGTRSSTSSSSSSTSVPAAQSSSDGPAPF